MTVKVGIIDDSLIVRSKLTKIINSEPGFEVVGSAENPFAGRELVLNEKPDVLTLDVEMPRLDGLTFLERLMDNYPLPVVMVSSFTSKTSEKGLKALELGAVEVVHKTAGDSASSIDSLEEELISKLRIAADARPGKETKISSSEAGDISDQNFPEEIELLVIGASTGGTRVLLNLFDEVPAETPPILICQHMPPLFTANFSSHLNERAKIEVREGGGKETVPDSVALLAPGDRHLAVRSGLNSNGVPVETTGEEKVNYQRPAVDVLFRSAAKYVGEGVTGVILTGMGKDGVKGSEKLAQAGGNIIVQDADSSTVPGMPGRVKEAVDSAREFNPEQLVAFFASLNKYV